MIITNLDINFYLRRLSLDEIERYLLFNDNNLFEKLSARLDIHEYSKKLYENAKHFALYDRERLIGFAPCYFNDEKQQSAYISALIILKSYQGTGLDKKLLDHIKDYAKQSGFKKIIVNFHCMNSHSIGFYGKNGFKHFNTNNDICFFKYKCHQYKK